MDQKKHAEELLREAACFGDEESVALCLKSGVNVNVQHSVNGWTPLHWAAKRGHTSVVRYLLSCGADPTIASVQGEVPINLTSNEEIKKLLSRGRVTLTSERTSPTPLPITPSYISNPPLAPKVDTSEVRMNVKSCHMKPTDSKNSNRSDEELVVKVRLSYPPNQDFIEVEIPKVDLSFANVMKICCEELGVTLQNVLKLRKLPNTMLRKDKDICRLHDFTELELVLNHPREGGHAHITNSLSSRCSEINGFVNTSAQNTRSSVSSPNLLQKSNFCKNGTILY